MTKDEALKMAIEALKNTKFPVGDKRNEAINACKEALEQPLTRDWKDTIDERIARDSEFKEALEQPAQEPVAWLSIDSKANEIIKTHQWQGLTDDEVFKIVPNIEQIKPQYGMMLSNEWNILDYARAIEAKLKEKNT